MRVKPDVREKTSAQETRRFFAQQHQDIISAMKARDGEAAARCMREHLLSVQWRVSAGSDEATLRHD
jgi:DNA-binding GntR family transcriptional regulator